MKRVMFVGEFSGLTTGYGVYAREVISRLHSSGRYEVCEFACGPQSNDPRIQERPWKVICNKPDGGQALELYNSNVNCSYGSFSFEKACLEFKPDYVLSIRDPWIDNFIERSPFRPRFRWIYMPTVDSIPQHEEWLSTIQNADGVLTYTDWGREVLGSYHIKACGVASPAANYQSFVPWVRSEVREMFGIEDDFNLIGMVGRNQPRKLFPNLIRAFATFCKVAPKSLVNKTGLYLHTTYPDIPTRSWDIPYLLKNSGVSHKILLTYMCRVCNLVLPCLFQDAVATCPRCGKDAMGLPNITKGIPNSELAKVYSNLDIFVQLATNEGFGMPLVEAAACGVPYLMATDYSAMSDVVRKLDGWAIPVKEYFFFHELNTYRALPDEDALVRGWIEALELSPEYRLERRTKSANLAREMYTYNQAAASWMKAIEEIIPSEFGWNSPPIYTPPCPIPDEFANNAEMVRWGLEVYAGRPDLVNSFIGVGLIKKLNWGITDDTGDVTRIRTYGVQDLIEELDVLKNAHNGWEKERVKQNEN